MEAVKRQTGSYRLLRLLGGGVLLGACLAAFMLFWQASTRADRGRTISPAAFRRVVASRPGALKGLVVFPISRTGEGLPVQFVTGEVLEHHGLIDFYTRFTFIADVPFSYEGAMPQAPTVADFLNGIGRSGTPVSFRFAWWSTARFIILACLVGSILLTVGAIPTIALAAQFVAGIFAGKSTFAPVDKPVYISPSFMADGNEQEGRPIAALAQTATPTVAVTPLPPADDISEPETLPERVNYADGEYYPVARTVPKDSEIRDSNGHKDLE
jgi:hypothetical protein